MTIPYTQKKKKLESFFGSNLVKKYQEKFRKLGLMYPEQFILHLPIRYEDETRIISISELEIGKTQQVVAHVIDCKMILHPRKQLIVFLSDDSDSSFTLRFFNFYASQLKVFSPGRCFRVLGEVRDGLHGLEMVHPKIKVIKNDEEQLAQTLTPIYRTTSGLNQSVLRSAINLAFLYVDLEEIIPQSIWQKYSDLIDLPSFCDAIKILHAPPGNIDQESLYLKTHPVWQRIKFEELLVHQISLSLVRLSRGKRRVLPMPKKTDRASLARKIISRLPFQLTDSQNRAFIEISQDLSRERPMHRLLQGDVGCGKTIVAALSSAQILDAGFQVVLMVPTELLAEQHMSKMHDLFHPFGINVVLLTSGQGKRHKCFIRSQIADGQAHFIIGTQAVIQEDIIFYKLGLVIIDEQHRFGVEQRLALRKKAIAQDMVLKKEADNSDLMILDHLHDIAEKNGDDLSLDIHQLMMSATPIPRTLAMAYFSDLDISTIKELPASRAEVLTRLVDNKRRQEVVLRIHAAALEGRQIYWVCPLIEESERLQLSTALEVFENLCTVLSELKIGLLHGKLSSFEKQEVMTNFIKGHIQLLVSTTIIEVGVDVPNASLMVIEHAERFGLAQLHQLRGRIGRGKTKSFCLLMYQSPLSSTARERLEIIRCSRDGFAIAKRDLDLRGPGEFFGIKQSGEDLLRFADPTQDILLLKLAQQISEQLLGGCLIEASKYLERWLSGRRNFWSV